MGLLKWLGLDFFKAEKQKEIEELQNEIRQIKQQLVKQEEKPVSTVATVKDKQFLSLHFDGHNLTVVDLEGNTYNKQEASKEDVKAVKDANTHQELVAVFKSPEVIIAEKKYVGNAQVQEIENLRDSVKQEETKAVISGFPLLSESGEFDVEDNIVYFKGIRRSLPKLLVNKFSKIVNRIKVETEEKNPDITSEELNFSLNEDLEFLAHKRFTYWCFLAPYPQVLDKLYPFLEKNGLKLTKEGFFLAIRNVVTVQGTKNDYADVITNAFNKIKAVWKKKPSNYEIWKKVVDGQDEFILRDLKKGINVDGYTIVGNLQDLNDNIKDSNQVKYTDDYTQTFDIRLNKWVTTDPKNIIWASENCVGTGGLHFSLDSTGLCGDKSLLIAVNPMHVTSVGTYKATSWAYFPFMSTEVYEARKLLLDQDFESFNLDFEKFSEEFPALEEAAKEGFKEHNKVEKFDLPVEELPKGVLNETEIKLVTKSLEEMKNELNKRVVEV